jgi:hypothetical protein
MNKVSEVRRAYFGSDAAATRRLHRKLESLGPEGSFAAHLLRAQKASSRAKAYGCARRSRHGDRYSDLAYDRKGEAISKLCKLLTASSLGLRWGWAIDHQQSWAKWVLYVDLPNGQVSFHSPTRGDGPDYPAAWDRQAISQEHILAYCEMLLANKIEELA